MEFKIMCIRAGMSENDAEEYSDLVGYSNWLDRLLMFYYIRGLIDGKEAAYELERLNAQQENKRKRKSNKT